MMGIDFADFPHCRPTARNAAIHHRASENILERDVHRALSILRGIGLISNVW